MNGVRHLMVTNDRRKLGRRRKHRGNEDLLSRCSTLHLGLRGVEDKWASPGLSNFGTSGARPFGFYLIGKQIQCNGPELWALSRSRDHL